MKLESMNFFLGAKGLLVSGGVMVPFLDPLMLATCGFLRNSSSDSKLWSGKVTFQLPMKYSIHKESSFVFSSAPQKQW